MSKVKTDRFGRPYQLVGCKEKKNSPDFNQGFVELGGKLYSLEVSPAKNPKNEAVDYWVKVTKLDKKQRHQSM